MANQTNRLKPAAIEADESSFAGLQGITAYAPANQTYTVAAITAAHAALQGAWTTKSQAEANLAAARDNAVAAEWTFPNLMLGAKDQVTAQFGRDSNEVQALKLKKSSERKTPQRKKPGAGDK